MLQNVLKRFPEAARPALRYEVPANLGFGAYLVVFSISLVVLETILQANLWCSAVLGMLFFGSSLFSPLVTYAGRFVPMRSLVVWPNVAVAALLLATFLPTVVELPGETAAVLFTFTVGGSFCIRVFPRVAEMNMYRVLYPLECRSGAVGLFRAISALSGLGLTAFSWWWFAYRPQGYPLLYGMIAALLTMSAWLYAQIPVPPGNPFSDGKARSPWRAFHNGLNAFLADRRFMAFQLGFAIAGIANHIGLVLIPRVVEEHVGASKPNVTFIVAFQPMFWVIVSSPFWGRFLDRKNPMTGRAVFNFLQMGAFALYTYGGVTRQFWPFVVGTTMHGLGNGGGMINWLTGSLYFASPERVSLYNGIHVCLTGLRGFIGPALGLYLFTDTDTIGELTFTGAGLGPWVFAVSAGLSLAGGLFMTAMSLTDPGPRENVEANTPAAEQLPPAQPQPVKP